MTARTVLSKVLVMMFALCVAMLPARAQTEMNVVMEEFTLANGLQVVVLPNNRAPLITHSIWYRVGSADEVAGKTGLAHFLEHMLFKGTAKFPKGTFDRLMKSNGAYSNAATSRDYTYYFQRIASNKLELVMEHEADRMQNVILTEADVVPERDVVKQERLQRIENDPSGPLWEQVTAAIYGKHPYARPVIGFMPDVEKLNLQDVTGFYRAYYQPRNAVVVIAGDVDVANVKMLAEKFYGVLKNTADTPARANVEGPLAKPTQNRFELTDARVGSPYVVVNFNVPSVISPEADDALALSFFGDIFSSGLESRLGKALVIGEKTAAQVGYSIGNSTRGPGSFSLYAVPNPGKGLKTLEAAMQKQLADILKDGVTQAELDRVRNRAFGNLVYDYDSPDSFMQYAGERAMLDGKVKEAFDTSAWNKMTVENVNAAARKYLASDLALTVLLTRNAEDMTGAAQQ
jgi:zinc protease